MLAPPHRPERPSVYPAVMCTKCFHVICKDSCYKNLVAAPGRLEIKLGYVEIFKWRTAAVMSVNRRLHAHGPKGKK